MDWNRVILAAISIIVISLLYREHCIASARCHMLIRKAEKATKERNFLAEHCSNCPDIMAHVNRCNEDDSCAKCWIEAATKEVQDAD